MRLQEFRSNVNYMRGLQGAALTRRSELDQKIRLHEDTILCIEEGQQIIQKVALTTQGKLKMALEDIISTALEIVFRDDAYRFESVFEVKNNRTTCEFVFTRNGEKFNPMDNSGFGAVDIAAFALRLALWNISKPKSRPVFILDEPFKHLSADMQEKAFEMVSELSKRLGLQIILVSHSAEGDVFKYSDRVIKVWKDKDQVSHAKIIKE